MGNIHPKLGYIDGFAGRGIYETGEPGSPILAMRAAQEQIDKIGKLKEFLCVFIENNHENYCCLDEQVALAAPECPAVTYDTIHSTFEATIHDFMEKIDPDRTIPILYFIDPFGWKGIPFETIKGIMAQPKSEILFVFMTYEMGRFLDSQFHEKSLTQLFNGDSWKSASRYTGEKRHEALVQVYEDLLKNETNAEYVWPFRVSNSFMRRTKYYIIYATHHFKGLRVMKKIMKRQGAGIFEYLGPDEERLRGQQRFDAVDLGEWLKNRFNGREVTFDELCEEVLPLSRSPVAEYIDSDYRKTIQALEKANDPQIEIIRVASKKWGLKENDIIFFK